MPTIKQLAKSKTNGINTAYFALFIILGAYDVRVPQEAIVAGSLIINVILRFITTKPLNEK